MNTKSIMIGAALLIGTSVWAHQGVKNPAVMARMNGMSSIAEAMKTLGDMAKQTAPFDVSAAKAALAVVADDAAQIPELFAAQEEDPNSEALPAIWETFDDFTREANELEELAVQFSSTITSLDDLRSAVLVMGQNCTSCHDAYRE